MHTGRRLAHESFSQLPGHLIRRVHQVSTALFIEECGAGLTAVQYAALVAIRSHPRIDATRLSGVIFFDRSTIGDVLDRMAARNWVVRRAAASDRRVKLLTLSPLGRKVLREAEPAIARIQRRLVAPLTAVEARTVVRLLAKMAEGQVADSRSTGVP